MGTADQDQEGTDKWYELEGGVEGLLRIRTQWRLVDNEDWVDLPEVCCLCACLSRPSASVLVFLGEKVRLYTHTNMQLVDLTTRWMCKKSLRCKPPALNLTSCRMDVNEKSWLCLLCLEFHVFRLACLFFLVRLSVGSSSHSSISSTYKRDMNYVEKSLFNCVDDGALLSRALLLRSWIFLRMAPLLRSAVRRVTVCVKF